MTATAMRAGAPTRPSPRRPHTRAAREVRRLIGAIAAAMAGY